jgi:hypothetical protein
MRGGLPLNKGRFPPLVIALLSAQKHFIFRRTTSWRRYSQPPCAEYRLLPVTARLRPYAAVFAWPQRDDPAYPGKTCCTFHGRPSSCSTFTLDLGGEKDSTLHLTRYIRFIKLPCSFLTHQLLAFEPAFISFPSVFPPCRDVSIEL